MNAKQISRYRSAVMGFTILWVMAYHSGMSFSFIPLLGNAANDFRQVGFGGVDIFLFLSGFGLYRSLSRDPDPLGFYRRRLRRLLPAYVPALAVWLFWNRSAIPPGAWLRVILGNLTGTSFWIGARPFFNWYMPALLAFYLLSPLLFRALKLPRGPVWTVVATLVLDGCFYGNYAIVAVSRLTVFVLGMILGRRAAGEGEESRPPELLAYALGALSYGLLFMLRRSLPSTLLWDSGLYWYPFIFIAPALVFLLCRFFAWLERRAAWLLRCFELIGSCSLEVYLIHIVAFDLIHPRSNWAWPLIYAAVILCGYLYHRASGKLLSPSPGLPGGEGAGKTGVPSTAPDQSPARLPEGPVLDTPVPGQTAPRKVYIDFLRISAAFLVIVNHTNSRIFISIAPSPTWFCSLTYFFICKTAVPLFFFFMGALLLEKTDPPAKTRARILRLFAVLAVSSLFYYIYYAQKHGELFSLKKFLLDLPRLPATNSFWYLYLYLALLCMLPILQRLAHALDERYLKYFLLFSVGVPGTTALISILFPAFQLSGYFTAGLIGSYVGQVLLGYYLERYVPMTRPVFWGSLCSFVLLIAFQVGGTFLLYQRNPASYLALEDRKLITVLASAAGLYLCVKYLFLGHPPRPRLANAISRLGSLTFGIYLLADWVLEQSIPLYTALCGYMHPLAAVVLWEVFIFALCALLTAGLRLIPCLRKWL